jgi:hypothetical protein
LERYAEGTPFLALLDDEQLLLSNVAIAFEACSVAAGIDVDWRTPQLDGSVVNRKLHAINVIARPVGDSNHDARLRVDQRFTEFGATRANHLRARAVRAVGSFIAGGAQFVFTPERHRRFVSGNARFGGQWRRLRVAWARHERSNGGADYGKLPAFRKRIVHGSHVIENTL